MTLEVTVKQLRPSGHRMTVLKVTLWPENEAYAISRIDDLLRELRG